MTAQLPTNEPRSHWHATMPPPQPGDELPTTSDVVVVGGGMAGVWTTYWLARAGAQVTLVERTAISWGATGRNGGIVGAGMAEGLAGAINRVGRDDALAILRLSQRGREIVGQVIPEEEIACDFRVGGSINLWIDEGTMAAAHRASTELTAAGLPVVTLDRQDVQEHIQTPLGPEIVGGIYNPTSALLHSAKYLAGVAAAAQRRGARLCTAEVQGFTPQGATTLVQTSRGDISARAVIVALNAWTDELVPAMRGIIKPVRGQVLAYAPMRRVFRTSMGVGITPTGEYWQQTLDGSIVLGGCRADAVNLDVDVRTPVPTDDVQASLERVFPRLFPELADLSVGRRWAGLMAFTSDYLPVVDRIPGLNNAWFMGGFCGSGMSYGPSLGEQLAQAALSGETPAAVAPLRMSRPSLVAWEGHKGHK